MALPLTRFGKRSNSRKPTLQQDSPTFSSNHPTSDLNQTYPVGGEPTATQAQGHFNSPKDIAITSPPLGDDPPVTAPDPVHSSGFVADGNAAGVERTEPTKPGGGHNTGLGAEPLADNHKAPSPNVDTMQSRFAPAKSSRIWDIYVKKTEEEDEDLVEDWDRVIDVTLVFAALFSAVSTAFVLESAKNLQTDQSKAAVLAIRDLTSIVQAGINASLGAPPSNVPVLSSSEDSFQPTTAAIWVNCLWFLSLGLSISVSLLAMLAKRWCYVFSRGSRGFGTSYERAIKRQETWDAIEQWKMELVIEQLPTLMHVALSK